MTSPLPLSDADDLTGTGHQTNESRRRLEDNGWRDDRIEALELENDRLRDDLTAAQSEISLARQMANGAEVDELASQFGGLGLENRPLAVAVANQRKRLEKAEAIERAAADIFRAITGGWGALQAIGPTHEQLAAYVTASNLAAPKEEQG